MINIGSADANKGNQKRDLTWRPLVTGWVMVLIGILLFVNETSRHLFAQNVQGTAVAAGGAKQKYSIYEYKVNENVYQAHSLFILNEIGEKHSVLYWEGDPSNGYVKNGDYFRGAVVIAIGLVFIGVARIAKKTKE